MDWLSLEQAIIGAVVLLMGGMATLIYGGMRAFKHMIDSSTEQITKLTEAIADKAVAESDVDTKLEALQVKLLESQLEEARQNRNELTGLRNQVSQQGVQIERGRGEADRIIKENIRLKTEKESLEEERINRERLITKLNGSMETMAREHKQERDELRKQIKELTSRVEQLEEQLQSTTKERDDLQLSLESMEQSYQELEVERDRLQERITELETEVTQLKAA